MRVKAVFPGEDITVGKTYNVVFEHDNLYELKCDTRRKECPKDLFVFVDGSGSDLMQYETHSLLFNYLTYVYKGYLQLACSAMRDLIASREVTTYKPDGQPYVKLPSLSGMRTTVEDGYVIVGNNLRQLSGELTEFSNGRHREFTRVQKLAYNLCQRARLQESVTDEELKRDMAWRIVADLPQFKRRLYVGEDLEMIALQYACEHMRV